MNTTVYIVVQIKGVTISSVESVWSTLELAEAAIHYYRGIRNRPNSSDYYVIEREINVTLNPKINTL